MTERVKKMLGMAPRQTGNKLIISSEKLEKRVALLENGVLEEYSIERPSDRNIVGSIYKGRVKNIEHGAGIGAEPVRRELESTLDASGHVAHE